MFSLLTKTSLSVDYKLTVKELIISGSGVITKEGVNSKGSVALITKVIINNGPNKISDEAFWGCKELKEINIPKSVTVMGQPFGDCDKLIIVNVDPESTTFCNDTNSVLYDKPKKCLIKAPPIKDLEIPDSVETIYSKAFSTNKFNYGNIILPASVVNLDIESFYVAVFDSFSFKPGSKLVNLIGFHWAKMTNITIPKSVTTIKASAFASATIENMFFESDSQLATIEQNSFYNYRGSSLTLPDSVKTIKALAFRESLLQTINIGSECSSIDTSSFAGCKNIKQITVSENNTHYSSYEGILMDASKEQILFISSNMETLKIISSVTNIGQTVLQSSPNLTKIEFDGENTLWSSVDGVLYSQDKTVVIAVCGGIKSVKAHASVTTISAYAAYGCQFLETFEFNGTSLESIGENAFSKSALTSFDLQSTVKTVGRDAFSYDYSLTKFTMKEDSLLTSIEVNFLRGSKITSFTFGKNIENIMPGAFLNCNSLAEITFSTGSKIRFIGDYAFESTSIVTLNIPVSIETLSTRCFRFCKQLETVVFNKTSVLATIPDISFEGCKSLWKIVLPDKCTTLGVSVFKDCVNLSHIEHKLTTIGSTAFENCFKLKTFTFSEKQAKTINPGIFKNCHNLNYFDVETGNSELTSNEGIVYDTNLSILYIFPPGQEMAKIPPSVTKFADLAFAFSPKLKFVAFISGSNLETIGIQAFYDCKLLTTVQFPAKLRIINKECFQGCSSLKSVLFPPTLESIDTNSFIGCERLRSVKYCGTNFVSGTNVFESFVVVSVTNLYEKETFCNIKVSKRLTYDCEVKTEFLPTCRVHFNTVISTRALFSIMFIFNC